jgi:hypothetical protein
MQYRYGVWATVGTAGFSADRADSLTLAFAPDGAPYVAYCDVINNLKATVMAQVSTKSTAATAIHSSLNPSMVGESLTFTATVSPAAATGTVSFRDGGTTLATASLSAGTAAYTTSTLSAGSHSITAVYTGDDAYFGSSSQPVIQQVNVSVTVSTTPAGLNFAMDGIVSVAPRTFVWPTAGAHTISVSSLQDGSNGTPYVFSGWSGYCAGCGSSLACPVTVDRVVTCTAAFVEPALVIIVGSSQPYSAIQTAYAAAGNGATIKAQAAILSEDILLGVAGKRVAIKGGYGPDFATQTGMTTLKGKLTIGRGGVVADRLVIQ